jgi:outer membrane protein assembly factor BamD
MSSRLHVDRQAGAGSAIPGAASKRPARQLVVILGLAALLPLQGCASSIGSSFGGLFTGSTKKDVAPDPPEKIYSDADTLMTKGKYVDAAAKFEDVDRHHPYAPQARRALVMQAFSLFKEGKYQDAISVARRYTTLHPGTKEAALAQHIIASSYFEEISDPARDQSSTKRALQELKILVQRYPDSEYAQKAQNRIRLANDTLAASEMNVGRYYLKEKNHLAAINRFKVVVNEHQTTAHVEEALARLTESYMALGIRQEAQTAAAVLGHNFPSSRWYKDAHALLAADGLKPTQDNSSWISKAWKTTVGKVTSAE